MKKGYIALLLLGIAGAEFAGITLINNPSLANAGSLNVGWALTFCATMALTVFIPQKTWDKWCEKYTRSYN